MADAGPSRSQPPRLELEVVRRAELWDDIPLSDEKLALVADAAFLAAPPAGPRRFEATLVLADDDEMRSLNRVWRGKDAATNVLSFPAGETVGEPAAESCPLGDVVLAGETVLREAAAQGIVPADHVCHLVVHGMLHLLGHDHERDDAADIMEALETEVLASLGIADPYAQAGAEVAEIAP